MFKYILVAATGATTDDAVFRTALTLARPVAGHLGFLHVRLDVQQVLISMAGSDTGGGGWGSIADTLQQEVEERHRKAHDAVGMFCEHEHVTISETDVGAEPTAVLRVDTGEEARLLAEYARSADLTVLGRMRDAGPQALDMIEAVLLGSGRPLLIAPEQAPRSIGRRIVVAWKNTAEAARAVAAAMPLIETADAVTVVSVVEAGRAGGDASAERLRQSLSFHNRETRLRIVSPQGREPVDALLDMASQQEADLLVMGGYSHSRMREAMFGGFTRHVLRAAGVAVLMAH